MQFFVADNEDNPQAYIEWRKNYCIKNAVLHLVQVLKTILSLPSAIIKGRYAVQKMELHISGEDGIGCNTISIPYHAMLDLRTRLFQTSLVQGRDYSINIHRDFIKFEDYIMIGLRDDIDISLLLILVQI